MNGVDYTKKLAQERENFQTVLNKDREINSRRLEGEKERNQLQEKKQLEAFNNDRVELEGTFKKRYDTIQDKTQKSVQEAREAFLRREKNMLEEHHKQQEISKKDYDGNIRNVSEGYKRAMSSQAQNHEIVEGEHFNRYQENVKRLTNEKDEKIKSYQERLVSEGAEIKEQVRQERDQADRAHKNNLQTIYNDETKKRYDIKDKLQRSIEKMRDVHEMERDQMKLNQDEKVSTLAETFNKRAGKMQRDYSQKNSSFVESQAKENKQQTIEQQELLAAKQRDFEKALNKMELDQRMKENGSAKLTETLERQQGLKDDQVLKDRLAQLYMHKVELERDFNKSMKKTSETYNQALADQKAESSVNLDRTKRHMAADKVVTLSDERENNQRTLTAQQIGQLSERDKYESQLSSQRNNSQNVLSSMKENFNNQLKKIEDYNEELMREFRLQSNEDHTKFVQDTFRQRNEEVMSLRRNFNNVYNTTVQDYEKRIDALKRDNDNLRTEMDQKLALHTKESDQRMQRQIKDYEEKRLADVNANKQLQDFREQDYRKKMQELSYGYQKRMDELEFKYENKISNMVAEYEARLENLSNNKAKELSERQTLHNIEMKRLKSAGEMDKAQVIAQYENQITELRQSHKEQLDKLNDYKNLA
jgi:hypothetical protein